MPDGRFPAPPYMRTARPGRQQVRTALNAPASGQHQANTSVAPTVVTDGTGTRFIDGSRSVKITTAPSL